VVLLLAILLFAILSMGYTRLSTENEQISYINKALKHIENSVGLNVIYQEVKNLDESYDRNTDYVRKVIN